MGLFDLFSPSKKNATSYSSGTNQSTTTTSRPDWQLPYIQSQVGTVANMPGYQAYTGATQAPRSALATQAAGMATSRAASGSPVLDASQGYNADVLAGNYLDANPWLDKTFNQAATQVGDQFRKITAPSIAGNFSLNGRYGSGAQRQAMDTATGQLADKLNALATNIYGDNYARERGNMEAAAARAPTSAAADWTDILNLSGLGTSEDQFNQTGTDTALKLWQANQTLPWTVEQARNSILSGNYGGTTDTTGTTTGQQTQPVYGPSTAQTGLGLAALLGGFFL